MKRITIELEIDEEEYNEFMEGEEVQGDLRNWLFAEICQNHGLGFLSDLTVEDVE